ncbi:DNA polymerase Y family protein [Dyadobacter sp. CY312]|uniref:Y-family DNA polymerase n=1 Tax=Dyadobacter sp. CY312 TaxID=2907303 RepID=UPI001F1B1D77|nr:DNA polymerase Y family protein [Dyadobacter sp. CY312]MCE7044101.1 DNA polymerase Y family protein [Dyadobacter sp. CY312]
MSKRYAAIWFKHLLTDQRIVRRPELKDKAFVIAAVQRGRMVITAASVTAQKRGVKTGMVLADARAIAPALEVIDHKPDLEKKLLLVIAEWCIRYSPIVALDLPDGLILDITGCVHLWGGEPAYLKDINQRLAVQGYQVRSTIADTVGCAWANSRYGRIKAIIEPDGSKEALSVMPPQALRLDDSILERLEKLGFYQIGHFMDMPRTVLRRRFGQQLLIRLDQALGFAAEQIEPVRPVEPYQERLPCLEPIRTAKGIEIALQNLLEALCKRLVKEGLGIRKAVFKAYRMDGSPQQIEIGTHSASSNISHLFKLFQLKIVRLRPDLGFELFILEAPVVEQISQDAMMLWNISGSNDQAEIAELLDRLISRGGPDIVNRYLPAQHYWPERSIKLAGSLVEKPEFGWPVAHPRPISLLHVPQLIDVTAPVPDYPPMLFRYQGQVHNVIRADGPERIEQEWWIQQGLHRDYYIIEDQNGARYWIFRLGHYGAHEHPKWFIHGFFS